MTTRPTPFSTVVLSRPVTVDGLLLVHNAQQSLVTLVATRVEGVPTSERLRMAMTRLRKQIGVERLPHTKDGHFRLALDGSAVDAWALMDCARSGQIDDLDDEQLFHVLAPCPTFDDLLGEPLRTAFVGDIRRAQRTLYAMIAERRPSLLGERLHGLVQVLIEGDEYNEHLLRISALCLWKAGNRPEATRVLTRARAMYLDAGLQLSAETDALHRMLLEEPFDVDDLPDGFRASPADLPAPLADQLGGRLVGAAQSVEVGRDLFDRRSRGVVSAVLTGESGVGKTRQCAELALSARRRGFAVRYARPSNPSGEAALGPFMAVFPDLRDQMARILGSDDDPESKKAMLWLALAEAISAESAGRPMLLIVDDAQWLDSYSSEALAHLLNISPDDRLIAVIAGRDEPESMWPTLFDTAQRAGADVIHVQPLDLDALFDLVHDRRPDLSSQLARGVATDLFGASRGLPGIATLILAGLDDDGLELPPIGGLSPDTALIQVMRSLPPDAQRLALMGSIVGPEFDLADVAATCDLPVARLLVAIDDLVALKWLRRRTATRFAVSHALVQSASVAGHREHEVAEAHRRAAEHFADDVHRRAFHEAEAIPLVPAEQALASLLASARELERGGLHREAAARFRAAAALMPEGVLERADAGLYARTLDLSGARGRARHIRQRAFEDANAHRQSSESLAIAVSGLPEAEPIDGDPIIVANLLNVDPEQLDREARWAHAHHLARQLTIVGRLDEAKSWAARCAELATSPHQRVAAAIAQRFAISATTAPAARVQALAGSSRYVNKLHPEQLGQYLLLLAIDQYEAGDHALAHTTLERLRNLGPDLTPVRRWHSMMFMAMLTTDAGTMEEARQFRRAASSYALACGFAEYENAYMAAEFVDLWIRRSTGFLRAEVGQGVFNPDNSVLARAGAATVLAEAGEWEAATAHADVVAQSVIVSPVSQATAALALASGVLARSERRDLVDQGRALLAGRGKSMIMIGAGAASLGPVARYVAALTDDQDERLAHLREALELAESAGSVLWRIVARRDLIEHGVDDNELRSEAVALAADAGLDDLLRDMI